MRKDRSDETSLHNKSPEQLTRERLLGLSVCVALIVAVAAMVQPALAAPMAGGMMFWAAVGAAVAGIFLKEPMLDAPFMTVWDQAAILLAGALIAAYYTDPAALEAARQAAEQSGGGVGGSNPDASPQSGAN